MTTKTEAVPENVPVKNDDFETHFRAYIKATASSMKHAERCAQISIIHFSNCGDLSPAQRFIDHMGASNKNYIRRGAFLKWLCAHAPVLMTNGKLTKDKGEKALPFNDAALLAAAMKQSFWDFAPDLGDIVVTSEDAFKRFMAAIQYFRRKNVKAADAGVLAVVNAVENVITHYQTLAKMPGTAPANETSVPEAVAEAA